MHYYFAQQKDKQNGVAPNAVHMQQPQIAHPMGLPQMQPQPTMNPQVGMPQPNNRFNRVKSLVNRKI